MARSISSSVADKAFNLIPEADYSNRYSYDEQIKLQNHIYSHNGTQNHIKTYNHIGIWDQLA